MYVCMQYVRYFGVDIPTSRRTEFICNTDRYDNLSVTHALLQVITVKKKYYKLKHPHGSFDSASNTPE